MADISLPTDLNLGASAAGGKLTVGLNLAATSVDGNAIGVNSSGQAAKADADGTVATAIGLLINGGAAGAQKGVVFAGKVHGLSGLTAGTWYYLSETAGRLCPIADLKASTPRVPLLYAISATAGLVAVHAPQPRPLVPLQVHVSNANAGVSSTKFATLNLPKKASISAITVTAGTVGAAGATVDVKVGSTSILDSAVAVSGAGAEDTATLGATVDFASGTDLLFYLTTGASTGSLVDCTVTVWVQLAE